MPLYEVWEKKTVFILDQPSVPPPVTPPGTWPGPHPSHPIMLPGMPGWGSGGSPPVEPPVIWPGPHRAIRSCCLVCLVGEHPYRQISNHRWNRR